MAAIGSGSKGLTIEAYKESMVTNGWGDNLVIAMLARCFNKALTVISKNSARTYRADGAEVDGTIENSIWIAHHSEFHYYGVLRAATMVPAVDYLGRIGVFSGSCPLCTTHWECGTCVYRSGKAK